MNAMQDMLDYVHSHFAHERTRGVTLAPLLGRYDEQVIESACLTLINWLLDRPLEDTPASLELPARVEEAQAIHEMIASSEELASLFVIRSAAVDFRDDVGEAQRRSIEEYVFKNYEPCVRD